MKKLLSYAALQLRRAARLLPRMLAVTLLLAVLTALAGLLFSRLRDDGADREPVRVALSGAVDGGMVGEALELLKSMRGVERLPGASLVLPAAVKNGHNDGDPLRFAADRGDDALEILIVFVRGHHYVLTEHFVLAAVVVYVNDNEKILAAYC